MRELHKLLEFNRQSFAHSRSLKKELSDRKSVLDSSNLALQNLLYERFHLEKEIASNDAFESIYQTIDLISEQEFIKQAPSELTATEEPHARMLNRLGYELNERKRLAQWVTGLQEKKQKLEKINKQKSLEISKLDTEVETLITVWFYERGFCSLLVAFHSITRVAWIRTDKEKEGRRSSCITLTTPAYSI